MDRYNTALKNAANVLHNMYSPRNCMHVTFAKDVNNSIKDDIIPNENIGLNKTELASPQIITISEEMVSSEIKEKIPFFDAKEFAEKRGVKMRRTAIAFGVLAIVFSVTIGLGFLFGLLALVFSGIARGIIGYKCSKEEKRLLKKYDKLGFILGLISLIITLTWVIFLLVWFVFFADFAQNVKWIYQSVYGTEFFPNFAQPIHDFFESIKNYWNIKQGVLSMITRKIILIYVGALVLSFVMTGFLFWLLVANGIVSPQSAGVQFIASTYNAVGYKISTPALTVEMLESARKGADINKVLKCVDPDVINSIETGEKVAGSIFGETLGEFSGALSTATIAKSILPQAGLQADLHFISIETLNGKMIAKIIITENDGYQTESALQLINKNGKWYIAVNNGIIGW